MIEARNVTKFFSIINEDRTADGLTAILSVSLKVEDGKIVSLLGLQAAENLHFWKFSADYRLRQKAEFLLTGFRFWNRFLLRERKWICINENINFCLRLQMVCSKTSPNTISR